MPRKRKKQKLTKILCFGIILATLYGYGAGRALYWNPFKIYRIWEARQFEKRLATEIYGCKSFGGYKFGSDFLKAMRHVVLRDRIYGKKGLAEFNGIREIQAEEYVRAIKKIYDKDVTIMPWNIRNSRGREVLERLFYNTPAEKLEEAIRNWNNKPSIEFEKPKDKGIDYRNFV